jgi:hypothetical protein
VIIAAHRLSVIELVRCLSRDDYRAGFLQIPVTLNPEDQPAYAEACHFFQTEFVAWSKQERAMTVAPITTRLRSLLRNYPLRVCLCAHQNFDLGRLWREQYVRYHVVTKADVLSGAYLPDTLGTYQVVAEQAEVVKRIFAQYASGVSLTRLSRELQADGIPTPRAGGYWRRSTLQRILKNPAYKGTPAFGRFCAKTDESRVANGRNASYIVPAEEENRIYLQALLLVSEQTFALCQQKLTEGRRNKGAVPFRSDCSLRSCAVPNAESACRAKR